MQKIVCLAIVVMLTATLCAQPATAPVLPKPVDTPEAAAARATLVNFWAAILENDVAKAKGLTDPADPALGTLVEQFASIAASGKKLADACEAKFGAEAKQLRGAELDPKVMADRLSKRSISVTGDTATVQGDGTTLRKIGGEWKLAAVADDPRAMKMMTAFLPVASKAMEETAAEVAAGKHATLKAVQLSMQEKTAPALQKLIGEMMQEAASAPATAPAGARQP